MDPIVKYDLLTKQKHKNLNLKYSLALHETKKCYGPVSHWCPFGMLNSVNAICIPDIKP